ncbi:MAG TPA: DUF3050 domain-containing protein [Kofleriaceae bacterium]|nr:DUF3050 domain-containing protein [Kofleriaceae bacterium]
MAEYAEQVEVIPTEVTAAPIARPPASYAELEAAVAPYRARLLDHEVYRRLVSMSSIRTFMEHHCYAVMDFMCLLKSLQQRLTVVAVPWFPPVSADAARFINEIVLGEECDVAPGGGYISHYELYVRAMREAGADADKVEELVALVRNHQHYRRALQKAKVPAAAAAFVTDSVSICLTGKNHEVAAYFLFGRENLIPDMFRRIVDRLRASGERGLDGLVYYLDRHIAIDEGEHGPAAQRMLEHLVAGEPKRWAEAWRAAQRAVAARLKLWDAIAAALPPA